MTTDILLDLHDRFKELHTEVIKVVQGLPAEALDWRPYRDMNSLAVLVIHLIGAERYWLGVAVGNPPQRDRGAEFETRAVEPQNLIALIQQLDEDLNTALEALQSVNLETQRVSPRNHQEFSISWALLHALEHSALHVGHLQLTKQLWEQYNK